MTRVLKICPRCKGEGEIERSTPIMGIEAKLYVSWIQECGVCLGTGFDESAEALSGE